MLIGFSSGGKSQYQRILELLPTYYPKQEDESDFRASDAFEQLLLEKENPVSLMKWKDFLKSVKISAKSGLRVSSSQWLMAPSFTGAFALKSEKMGRARYKRKFVVYLSLIGNFYAMYGLDSVGVEDKEIKDDMYSSEVRFEPILYPYPYSIYRKWFLLSHQAMKEAYPDYEFVSHHTWRTRLKEVSTGDVNAEGASSSIFQALFSSEDVNRYRIRIYTQVHPFSDSYGFE